MPDQKPLSSTLLVTLIVATILIPGIVLNYGASLDVSVRVPGESSASQPAAGDEASTAPTPEETPTASTEQISAANFATDFYGHFYNYPNELFAQIQQVSKDHTLNAKSITEKDAGEIVKEFQAIDPYFLKVDADGLSNQRVLAYDIALLQLKTVVGNHTARVTFDPSKIKSLGNLMDVSGAIDVSLPVGDDSGTYVSQGTQVFNSNLGLLKANSDSWVAVTGAV